MQALVLPSSFPEIGAPGPSYPPFNETEILYPLITADGRAVLPHIEGRIDKGFFKSSDSIWTMYARNRLSIECSCMFQPNAGTEQLFLARIGDERSSVVSTRIWALAICPRLEIFDHGAPTVGLYQQTRSRERGKITWQPVNKHFLSPSTTFILPPGPTSYQEWT